MRSLQLLAAALFAFFVTFPGALRAQGAGAPAAEQSSLVGTWQVSVDGFPETRTLIVAEEGATPEGMLLNARYGITGKGQGPISARMIRAGGLRQLEFVTQAATKVVATEQADGSFKGTFTLKSGAVHAVVIARAETAASKPSAQALPPGAIGAPVHAVGDQWVWRVRVSPRDRCTNGIAADARLVETVTAVTSAGYVAEVNGPREGTKSSRSYGKDLAFRVTVGGESFRSDVLNFPIQPGKSWDTTLFGGNVHTVLNCSAEATERLRIGDRDLEVAPITCKGTWKNLQSGNGDQAIYKYWYSPERRNVARRTVFTYMQGATCADVEYLLEAATTR